MEQETTIQIDNAGLNQLIGSIVDDKEKVLSYVKAQASVSHKLGILAVTNKRMMYRDASVTIILPFRRIRSATYKKSLLSRKIIVEADDTITFTGLVGGYQEVVARITDKLG